MPSPADILKEHEIWIQSTPFVKLVAEQLQISERTAFRRIEKDVRNGLLRKLTLPDRSVLYGLSTWPFPEAKKDEIKKLGFFDCLKHRGEIKRHEKEKDEKEREAQTYAEVKWLAENWPAYESLKEYFEIRRKVRKEYGLDE